MKDNQNKQNFFLFLLSQALNLTDLVLTTIYVHILKTGVELNPIIRNIFILITVKVIAAIIIYWLWKTNKNKTLACVTGVYLGSMAIIIMNLIHG